MKPEKDERKLVDDLVDFSDFYATFSELGQAPGSPAAEIDGRSFARRLLGEGPGLRKWAFAQGRGKHWVRTQRWKLYDDGPFFDVQTDPAEKKNLTGDIPAEAAANFSLLQKALNGL